MGPSTYSLEAVVMASRPSCGRSLPASK